MKDFENIVGNRETAGNHNILLFFPTTFQRCAKKNPIILGPTGIIMLSAYLTLFQMTKF